MLPYLALARKHFKIQPRASQQTPIPMFFITRIKRFLLRLFGQVLPTDLFAQRHPVSIKGICLIDEKVVLVRNNRREWDLPGGKLGRREQPEECLVREMREELSIDVTVGALLRSLVVRIMDLVDVLVLVYQCETDASTEELELSYESMGMGTFSREELAHLELRADYREAIERVFELTC